MFGLSAFFAALARLTRSVNTSADMFDAANDHLQKQLAIDAPADAPALGHKDAEADDAAPRPPRNGRKATA